MSLLKAVRECLLQTPSVQDVYVAYSGGLDSQVLLVLCQQLRAESHFKLRAIHINHGLSQNAKEWANHCKQTCNQLDIEYIERAVQLDLSVGESIEEVARQKRYAIFAEYMNKDDVLLTAHHQDDQAETLLLQLMRGSGPKGLAAMPRIKSFANGYQARPLLDVPRFAMQQFAKEQKLRWVEDESNQNLSFSRNFIRHEILSKLKTRWPSVTAAISRSASHCAENQKLIEAYSEESVKQVQGSRDQTLSVSKLLWLSPEKQRLLLRAWIQQLKFPLPDTKKMETIQRNVLLAAWDSKAKVQWGKVVLRRHRDDIHLSLAKPAHDLKQTFAWELNEALTITMPLVGNIQAQTVVGRGLRLDITQVSVRFRQGGELLDLPGRGRHTLKNLFQEWQVLPWEREVIPLIYLDNQLIAVPGYFMHENVEAKANELGRELVFIKQAPSLTV